MRMQVTSISGCLNFIDNLILCGTEKHWYWKSRGHT